MSIKMSWVRFFIFPRKLAKLAEGAVLRLVMSLACRSAIFLAEGPKFGPEPNFLLVSMAVFIDVYNMSWVRYFYFAVIVCLVYHSIFPSIFNIFFCTFRHKFAICVAGPNFSWIFTKS